ncbi:hypothetical protein WISP_55148 [Willisornis vidua]|uniref:Uncharacterized protein n=1 Tax=Willisornis vidua TaxID=1566151 RepID=A0ABQ9DD04_9PASS|nr:hypothetical protein WISP_55148 [Willisornis vidua]
MEYEPAYVSELEPALYPGGQEDQWNLGLYKRSVASRTRAVFVPLDLALLQWVYFLPNSETGACFESLKPFPLVLSLHALVKVLEKRNHELVSGSENREVSFNFMCCGFRRAFCALGAHQPPHSFPPGFSKSSPKRFDPSGEIGGDMDLVLLGKIQVGELCLMAVIGSPKKLLPGLKPCFKCNPTSVTIQKMSYGSIDGSGFGSRNPFGGPSRQGYQPLGEVSIPCCDLFRLTP